MSGKLDLRTLVEYEGADKPLADLFGLGATDLQFMLVVAVREIYRPARQKLRSEKEGTKVVGREGMRVFADMSRAISERATEKVEAALALLAQHNVASAYGVLGSMDAQAAINKVVIQSIEAGGDDWKINPDLLYVHSMARIGIIENDSDYRKGLDLIEWLTLVTLFKQNGYPDFAGRVVRFVREVKARGYPGDFDRKFCYGLLEQAATDEVSKQDQRDDAQAMLVDEFEATFGRRSTP